MLITALQRLIASHKQKQDDENTIKYLDDVLNSLTEGVSDSTFFKMSLLIICRRRRTERDTEKLFIISVESLLKKADTVDGELDSLS